MPGRDASRDISASTCAEIKAMVGRLNPAGSMIKGRLQRIDVGMQHVRYCIGEVGWKGFAHAGACAGNSTHSPAQATEHGFAYRWSMWFDVLKPLIQAA